MDSRQRPADAVIVIFGGKGDLARRKLLPSLWRLHRAALMPRRWRLLGTSRSEVADREYRDLVRSAISEFGGASPAGPEWEEFAGNLHYCGGVAADDHEQLARAVHQLEADFPAAPQRLLYLSVPPATFGPITWGLGASGLAERARVVFEKPFGTDAASFAELDAIVHSVLAEQQIYRIDHFLGKETLQNVMALRFANGMFEPIWNRQHIDHVQIDSPEDLGIGSRAAFYEGVGALRDMVVTHLFQVLSVVALEPPVAFEPEPLMDEKRKVFDSIAKIRCEDVVYGQYEGYTDEPGVAAGSTTETFAAVKLEVDNWRWSGVPFLLRTGKRMAEKRQTVTLAFREPPREMFRRLPAHDRLTGNHLTLDLGRDEGVELAFLAKEPGPLFELSMARMTFSYAASFGTPVLGPYETLIHDALVGDRTLFTRADGIGRTWEIVSDLLAAPPELLTYPAGSWGPAQAHELIAPRRWHLP